jgi:hypothetical protein
MKPENEEVERMPTQPDKHHDGPGRSGLVNADPAHAPGKGHLDLRDVSGRTPKGGPAAVYARTLPAESKKSHRQHSRRGH